MRVVLDFETRSEVDLKKSGVLVYAQHPTTEIICCAYKIDAQVTHYWVGSPPKRFFELMADPDVVLVAHNALFEISILKWVLYLDIPVSRFRCTAAKAAAHALPRNLEGAALALNLPIKKDVKEGGRLIKKYCKPRPQWTKHRKGRKYFDDPDEFAKIFEYCRTDVEVTALLDDRLSDLIPLERKVWLENIKSNLRGVPVDVETAKKIVRWIDVETDRMNRRLEELTDGAVSTATQRDAFLRWLRDQDVTIANLQAKTVEDLLALKGPQDVESIQGPVREALILRQSVGRAALKKYPAILARVSEGNRVGDFSLYHGAHTGREAGRGLQLQNVVKGKIKDTETAIQMLQTSTLDEIRFLYGDPFEVFSSCVRSMVTADEGNLVFNADYTAIEARVLSWMAGDACATRRYHEGVDTYVIMAAKIFGKQPSQITKAEREVGKRVVLGAGYGIGWKKFYDTCVKYNVKNVTPELAKRAVEIYRKSNPLVVRMWSNLERCAMLAAKGRGPITTCKTIWSKSEKFLWCELPSGRKLAFYDPCIKLTSTSWGESRGALHYWSVNPKTKKWELGSTYGGRLVENVVSAVARDVMVEGMLRVKKLGFKFMFAVHDEINSQGSASHSLEEYVAAISKLPVWAKGLPVKAGGWTNFRYGKR